VYGLRANRLVGKLNCTRHPGVVLIRLEYCFVHPGEQVLGLG
jgi:hypothetical protein